MKSEEEFDLPFAVQIIEVSSRTPDNKPMTVDVRILDYKWEETDMVMSVSAEALTDYKARPINVDRELAIAARDNVVDFPSERWVDA